MPAWLVPGPFPPEFMTDERCSITELMNLSESPEASLALARVAPGVTTRLHAVRGIVERYVVLSGEGIVEVGGETAEVGPGDRVLIPAGAPQRITNTGAGELEFYCLCTPRFRPAAYVDLEAD
jgi:mannose-6-phosphate isomerase-like protein (cupin superfamily)